MTAIESSAGGSDFTWRAVAVIPGSNSINLNKHSSGTSESVDVNRELVKDKNDIAIERQTNFGVMIIGSEKKIGIEITNIGSQEQTLVGAAFQNQRGNFRLVETNFPAAIWPHKGRIFVQVSFRLVEIGLVQIMPAQVLIIASVKFQSCNHGQTE